MRNKNEFYAAIGAVVEWYDVLLYGYLATVFARLFFPDSAPSGVALAATFGGFAIGFLTRPIGGIFFGWFGDHRGRKAGLTLAITMMAIPMVGTALLPTYDAIGWLAPILLIVMRMIQGFSSGGEYSGTLVFLAEDSAGHRRGRTVAIATACSGIGVLLAALVTAILNTLLTEQQMDTWGWRLPYALGSLIIVLGIFMRMHMTESAEFTKLKDDGHISRKPIRDSLAHDWPWIVRIAILTGYGGIAYFIILTYLVSYLEDTVDLSAATSLWIGTGAAAIYVVTATTFGRIADRFGRKPPMLFAAIALIAVPVPMFLLIGTGNIVVICLAVLVMLIPAMAFFGSNAVACTEFVPTIHRSSGVSIGYNFGAAIIGSTAPLIAQVLVDATGRPTMPAWYLVVASVIVIPVIWKLPETAFLDLRSIDDRDRFDNEPSTRS